MRVHRPETGVRYHEANGLRFAALEWGQGPLVLLFHGFPDTAQTWDEIGPSIAKAGYRVVAPFMRGFAPSALPPRDPGLRTLGEDVVALIAALGEQKARIVGHDWGAEAVYAATALAPERIERLVTIAIPHRATLSINPRLVWTLRHFITLQLPGAAGRFAKNDFAMVDELCRRWSPTWQFGPADLEPVKNAFAAPGCLDAALGYYRAAEIFAPPFLRPKVGVPTLTFAGADDPGIAPAAFEEARSHYTGRYDVVTIRGGHFCHRESTQAFLDAAIPFLA
jgi:pimeloyl-ACP methyl ester carboxylesterase